MPAPTGFTLTLPRETADRARLAVRGPGLHPLRVVAAAVKAIRERILREGLLSVEKNQLQLAGEGGALRGLLVALCVPVAGAVQWTVTQRSQAHGEKLDLVPCVLVGAVISTLLTLPLSVPFVATAKDIAWLGLLGLVQLAIPCTLSVVCARVLKAPEVSLLALLEIIFGIALAWLGANEQPGANVLTGGTLVLGALVVNEWLGWRQRT